MFSLDLLGSSKVDETKHKIRQQRGKAQKCRRRHGPPKIRLEVRHCAERPETVVVEDKLPTPPCIPEHISLSAFLDLAPLRMPHNVEVVRPPCAA